MQLPRSLRRMGWAALALFALKGVTWLVLVALAARSIPT